MDELKYTITQYTITVAGKPLTVKVWADAATGDVIKVEYIQEVK